MSTTNPGDNGFLASKYLLSVIHRDGRGRKGFANMLTDGMKMVINSEEADAQSSEFAPIVMGKAPMGQDKVQMRVFHDLEGAPAVGNEQLEGREGSIESSKFEMEINYTRMAVVDEATDQLRNEHEIADISEKKLKEWVPRWQSEVAKYMLAGGRGTIRRGNLMPLDDGQGVLDHKTINGIQAPTFREKYYGGDGGVSSVNNLGSNSIPSLTALERITNDIDDADDPLAAVRYEGTSDIQGLIFLSNKGWEVFKQSDDREVDRRMAEAKEQVNGWNHEIFKQRMAMVNNYLIMRYPGPAIRWTAGDQIVVSDDNDEATTHLETVPAGLNVERGIVLGGQALANMYGTAPGKWPIGLVRDSRDYGFIKGVAMVMYNSMKKIRLRNEVGRLHDVGVRVIDYVVPR